MIGIGMEADDHRSDRFGAQPWIEARLQSRRRREQRCRFADNRIGGDYIANLDFFNRGSGDAGEVVRLAAQAALGSRPSISRISFLSWISALSWRSEKRLGSISVTRVLPIAR